MKLRKGSYFKKDKSKEQYTDKHSSKLLKTI